MVRKAHPWLRVGLDAIRLGAESASVIGLRVMMIAGGGAASKREISLMVSEKVKAGLLLQSLAMSGRLGHTPHDTAARTIAFYRRKVRANRHRLSGTGKR